MTRFGRVLLFLNLVLSLGFAFWAFAIYTQRIDWTTTKSPERQGEYAQRAAALDSLKTAIARGESRLDLATQSVKAEEDRIPKYVAWYKVQLENLRTGKNPVRAPVINKGQLQLDKDGYPRLGPVLTNDKTPIPGLASLDVLHQDYLAKQQQIVDTIHETDAAVDKEKALTVLIGNGKDKGLRAQLAAELLAEKNSVDEQEFLKPLLYNRQVELQVLAKRSRELQARLKELQASRVAEKP